MRLLEGVLVGFLLTSVVYPAMSANADDPAVSAKVSKTFLLGTSYSEDDAYGVRAGANFQNGASTFNVGLAFSRSPQELADLTTYRGNVAFDHDFSPFGLSVGYDYWGDFDLVDAQTVSGSIYVHGSLGRIALLTEFRDINLRFDVPAGARSSKSAQGKGIGASARYEGGAVDFYASGMHYDYDIDVGRLRSLVDVSRVAILQRPALLQRVDNLVLSLRRLNSSTLTLANGFLDYGISAGIEIHFEQRMLNIELSRDKTIIDGAILNGGSIGFLHPLCDACDIEYRLGVSDDETFGSSVYGGVQFYWYR